MSGHSVRVRSRPHPLIFRPVTTGSPRLLEALFFRWILRRRAQDREIRRMHDSGDYPIAEIRGRDLQGLPAHHLPRPAAHRPRQRQPARRHTPGPAQPGPIRSAPALPSNRRPLAIAQQLIWRTCGSEAGSLQARPGQVGLHLPGRQPVPSGFGYAEAPACSCTAPPSGYRSRLPHRLPRSPRRTSPASAWSPTATQPADSTGHNRSAQCRHRYSSPGFCTRYVARTAGPHRSHVSFISAVP
jgi:hypothetical protein